MDCRETRELLNAFHDGELPGAERSRVEGHLRGCPACSALLADLARADRAADVPDPGPGYWERFNARVAERVEGGAGREVAAAPPPKGGWVRQQLRYLVPAAAAAALVVLVVRYGALGPGPPGPAAPPAASEPAEVGPAGQPAAGLERVPPAATRQEPPTAGRRAPPSELGRADGSFAGTGGRSVAGTGGDGQDTAAGALPAAPPAPRPGAVDARIDSATRAERARGGDRAPEEGKGKSVPDRPVAPAGAAAPSPPAAAYRAASPPAREREEAASFERDEERKMAAAEAPAPGPPAAAPAETSLAKQSAMDRSAVSPCERARALAARDMWRAAEAAQRECLVQDRSAPAQEKGLVFLAELLDRQARFAEADAVIAEVSRQFPRSHPLDLYRQQRPMVQRQQAPPPATR